MPVIGIHSHQSQERKRKKARQSGGKSGTMKNWREKKQ